MGPAWHLMSVVDRLAALLIMYRMPCNGAKTVTQSLCVGSYKEIHFQGQDIASRARAKG